MKAFHGCRPLSVRSYYEKGFLSQSEAATVESFKTIFHDVDERHLRHAIDEMSERGASERGKVYFLCDDRAFVDECGHYLIQGSEYLMALVASLCLQGFSAEEFPCRLWPHGVPTIFEANIPLSHVPAPFIDAFCRSIVAEWARRAGASDAGGADEQCVILNHGLEPEYIRSHWHPRRIPDPHMAYGTYVVNLVPCDAC